MLHLVQEAAVVGADASAAAWSLLVGALTPFLIAAVNRPTMTVQARQIVAAVISLLVGLITVILGGTIGDWTLSLNNGVIIMASVVGSAQLAYALIWKPTKIAEVVELATTPAEDKPQAA